MNTGLTYSSPGAVVAQRQEESDQQPQALQEHSHQPLQPVVGNVLHWPPEGELESKFEGYISALTLTFVGGYLLSEVKTGKVSLIGRLSLSQRVLYWRGGSFILTFFLL